MPIVVVSSSSSSTPSSRATLTAGDIITRTTRDLQNQVLNTLDWVDWVDRAHLDLCRLRQWEFLVSTPQRFITRLEQPNYWVGASAGQGAGQVDTGLNLSDVDFITEGGVHDGTNYTNLINAHDLDVQSEVAWPDRNVVAGKPAYWRLTEDTPTVISLAPAPDNQSTYQPFPPAPYCTTTSGGALSARTYYVRTTYVDSAGNESAASENTKVYVPASYLLKVWSPTAPVASASGITYTSYKVYASATEDSEVFQTGSTTTIGTAYTEGAGGLYTGTAAYPTDSDIEVLGGYVIEFRYYKKVNTLSGTSASLQLPDDWRDVLVAGVNALAYEYLADNARPDAFRKAQDWSAIYERGKQKMIRNERWRKPPIAYIAPDPTLNDFFSM